MAINRELIQAEYVDHSKKEGFSFDAIKNGYNEAVATSLGRTYEYHDTNTHQRLFEKQKDYAENKEYYDAFTSLDIEEKDMYRKFVSKGHFSLEDGEMVSHSNAITSIIDTDAIKGILLSTNITKEQLDAEYKLGVSQEIKQFGNKKYSMGGEIASGIGGMAAWATDEESILELFTPTKILGKSLIKNMGKAFGVEFTAAGISEAIKQYKPYGVVAHNRRAGIKYGNSEAAQTILINAGFAGVLRGIGSGIEDKVILNKIEKRLGKKDLEVFARYNSMQQSKLVKNQDAHEQILNKVSKNLDDEKTINIETDIDIETKTNPEIEPVSMKEEQQKAYNEKGYNQTEEVLNKEIDDSTNIKIEDDIDPFVEETFTRIEDFADDPEIMELMKQLDDSSIIEEIK